MWGCFITAKTTNAQAPQTQKLWFGDPIHRQSYSRNFSIAKI